MPRCSFVQNKSKELKKKNVIIGEPRPKNINDKIQAREVMMEKTPDGKESLKITVKTSRPGGKETSSQKQGLPNRWEPVRFDRLSVKPVRSGFGLGRYQISPNSKFKFEFKKIKKP